MIKNTRKINLKEVLIVFIILILTINLVKSWIKLKERINMIKEARIRLVEEQVRSENLKKEFAKTQTYEFIEEQAREKLNLGKEGEFIILMPTPVVSPSVIPTPVETLANWQKWLRLFL